MTPVQKPKCPMCKKQLVEYETDICAKCFIKEQKRLEAEGQMRLFETEEEIKDGKSND